MVEQYVEVKHGRREAEYPHPLMKDILEETHGVMVYQEQVMRILNRLGSIELSSAYTCIKAISKKKLPMIAKFKKQFIDGAVDKGLDKKKADELVCDDRKFAGYGFNKSHSTAYALIAFQTAYLKAHYPVEFMAALLTGDIPGRNFKRKDALVEHLEDCRRMNIEVIPPCVQLSDVEFTVHGDKIAFGLSAIKGCGGAAAEAIVAARKKGEFTDLYDFCERVDPSAVGRAAIETLIKAGGFDCFGAKRSQMLAIMEKAIQAGSSRMADRRSGQKNMFEMFDDQEEEKSLADELPKIPEWDEKDKLIKEKEVLGFYLSSHPLAEHTEVLKTYCTHKTSNVGELAHRTEILVGGMMSALKFSSTKNPKPGAVHTKYVMFDLEDLDGIIRCIMWPTQFAEKGQLVSPDAIMAVKGSIDRRPGSDEANLIVNELIPLDDLPLRYTRGVMIRLYEKQHGPEKVEQLYEILRGYPGKVSLQLVLELADSRRAFLKCEKLKVDLNSELRQRVDDLLGEGNLKMLAAPPKVKVAAPRNGRSRFSMN